MFFYKVLLNTNIFLYRSFWPVDRTLTSTTTPDHSGPGSNVNEKALDILQISRTETLPSDQFNVILAQLAGAVEYTDCFSAKKQDPSFNEYPVYDIKQSDGEVTVMLELWEMRSALSLPSLPYPLWTRVVAPDRALAMGQIELNCVLISSNSV